MIFGKIVNNKIIYANINSTNVKSGNKLIWGRATKESLLNLGFEELEITEKPQEKEGFSYYYTWEIVDNKITCVWHELEITDEFS